MQKILTSFFDLASTALNYLPNKKRIEYGDKLYVLKKTILEESLKPVDEQDHALLERCYQEIPLVLETIQVEFNLHLNSGVFGR